MLGFDQLISGAPVLFFPVSADLPRRDRVPHRLRPLCVMEAFSAVACPLCVVAVRRLFRNEWSMCQKTF